MWLMAWEKIERFLEWLVGVANGIDDLSFGM